MHRTLSEALSERGYDTLTPVQEAVTRPDLEGRDLLVSAQTGSGKTVGFGLAIAPTLLGDDDVLPAPQAPLALIVAPTRELAMQVARELRWLYGKAGARVSTCIGGMDMRDERRDLDRGAHIVVGTPGRLRDHIQRESLAMTGLRAIVLDEADEMLDLGFREDLEFMLGEAPAERRTLLFSATVPPMIARLAEQYQRDATRVTTLTSGSQHADITYQAVRVAPQDTENAIINLLRFEDAENAIVFANTRATVNRLAARLSNRAFSVVALSGELSQAERSHALQAMRDGRARVCVATDVAARGIDLPKLDLVIHAELPSNADGLLHRSGRTGRAGRKGISALIVPPKAVKKAERLLQLAKIRAEWTTPPSADAIRLRDEERLLNDPVWSEEPAEYAFAARLLALHGPEKVAAAYLALYRARLSAPEDLADPGQRSEPAPRAPFGPSVWFALSTGRDAGAEPRRLLPLLIRAGGLTREDIGAIRIRPSESHVEIKAAAVPGFLSAIGVAAMLEDGVTARKLDAAPDPRPGSTASDSTAPRETEPRREMPVPAPSVRPADNPTAAAPVPTSKAAAEPAKPHRSKPQPATDQAKRKPGPARAKIDTPRTDRKHDKPKAPKKSFGKAGRDGTTPRDKPYGKGGRDESAPRGKASGKPARKDKFGSDKAAGRPKTAERKGPAPSAADTSRRFTPPGAAGKPAGHKSQDAAARRHVSRSSSGGKTAKPGKPRRPN